MNFLSRSSLATGPKIRVALGVVACNLDCDEVLAFSDRKLPLVDAVDAVPAPGGASPEEFAV